MGAEVHVCEFCGIAAFTNGHHVVPKCKGGTTIVQTCETCENFIHRTWSHNELRDTFNTVEAILVDEKFQKFLKWRRKQPASTIFKSDMGKNRNRKKYS